MASVDMGYLQGSDPRLPQVRGLTGGRSGELTGVEHSGYSPCSDPAAVESPTLRARLKCPGTAA
ncbi:hypothetical protein KCMC57_up53250 [Kitasatospora sp. CMC57]|uniref:Uncharacterized protein n=1 Tax=Kitasatospora sp. CMC57 TaxID=3231513 RepID=A0AB33K5J7_9ACTN